VAEIERSRELGSSQGKAQDLVLKVMRREVTKWREDRSHPSEEDRWQR
jgi:hypothetical protein